MRIADIKKLSTDELNIKIAELKKELFNLRFQLAVGQLENTAKIGQVKKMIAQMKTIISQRG